MNNEIQHFGILGMKWGVRRYQNKDGSLTPEGKKRMKMLYGTYAAGHSNEIVNKQKRIKDAGIVSYDKDTDYIKKGAVLRRYSSTGEETHDSKRKYVSLTDRDDNQYNYMAYEAWFDNTHLYELESNKKLKVATGKKVLKDLVDKYGDRSVKEAYDLAKSYNFDDDFMKSLHETYGTKSWQYQSVRNNTAKISDFAGYQLLDKKKFADISKEYSDKGYDAIVDAQDFIGYFVDYPVILLNPGKDTKVKGVQRLFVDG